MAKTQELAETAASRTDQALGSIKSGIDTLREAVPTAFSRAAAQVDDLTRRSVERAREAGTDVRDQVVRASDRTVGYIKDEPVKSVLVAAATGAAVALLVGWAMRSRAARE